MMRQAMLYACRADADGMERIDGKAATWLDRQRLRIAETAWWMDSRYPESISVCPTGVAKDVKVPEKGFNGQRFLLGSLLKPGDGRKAGMIWTTHVACERKLTFDNVEMEFLDVSGARVRPARTGNVYSLAVSGSPIYFLGGELKTLP